MSAARRCLVSLVVLAVGSTTADAAFVTFSNRVAFIAATGATDASGPLPNLGLVPGGAGASQTVGTVTFTLGPAATELYIGTAGVGGVASNDWTLRLSGPDIAISGPENLNAALAAPVFSLGFDFAEPENDPNLGAPFVDSTFTVTLFNGSVAVGSFAYNAPNDVAAFVGVWSDAAFTRIEIRETGGGIDDEFFGPFYTGATPFVPAAVPEPASVGLLTAGAAGLLGYARRRRAARA